MHRFAALACLAWSVALPGRASAQTFPADDFSAHRFYVAPGSGNFLAVEGAETGPDLTPTFGATLGYAHRSFVADDLDCLTGSRTDGCENPMNQETSLLGHLVDLQLHGSITLLERIQIGLNVPLLYYEGERYQYLDREASPVAPRVAAPGGSGVTLGDPRLSVKIRILDPDREGNGVMIGAGAWVSAPLGHAIAPGHFVGDLAPSFGAHFIGSFRLQGFRLALNLGGQVRAEATNLRSVVGTELTYGVAAAYRFHPLVEALVELAGFTSFGARFDSEAPLELRGAMLFHIGDFALNVGGGAGLVYGIGAPVGRVFVGGSFTPTPDRDTDGDGLLDRRDACPTDPEDLDGFADEDGCPDPDNDEDGIPDAQDGCPNDAEDVDEFQDEDGCPDEDDDGDGIRDGYDSCPRAAEDVDGDRDEDGCPDDDTDQDGIPDDRDACPDRPEDFDGLADEDGCPEEDADGDGVADEADDCPEEAGSPLHRGCAPPADRGR